VKPHRLTPFLILAISSIASAHPGHGPDPVHYVTGLDWPIALLLMLGGMVMVRFTRHTVLRIVGGVAACSGLIFATTLL
jgi:hypothetical protein